MSKKNNVDQMLVKLKPGEKKFLKKKGIYGRKCVDYALRKIKEEIRYNTESDLQYKIYKSELLIEEYENALTKERLFVKKMKDELNSLQKIPSSVRDSIICSMNELYDSYLEEHRNTGYDCSLENFFEDKMTDIGIIGVDNNYMSDDEVIDIYREYFLSVNDDNVLDYSSDYVGSY